MDGLYYVGCDMLLMCFRVETLSPYACCISMRIVYQHPFLGDGVESYLGCQCLFENEHLQVRRQNVPEFRVKEGDNEVFIVYLRGNNCSRDYRWSAIEVPKCSSDSVLRDIVSNLIEFFTHISGHRLHAVMEIPLET